jgi:hypothetical protein
MEKIVRDLEAAGNHLTEFEPMMFLSDVKQWPTPPDEIPGLLSRIASCLREALSRGKWKKLRNFTGSRRIPYVVEEMRRRTRRPHYKELATLIGAAYGRPDYAETNLKMCVSHNRSVDDSNASNPK